MFQCLLGSLSGSMFGRFWVPKSTQNRSRIGVKSEEATKSKNVKKPLVFQWFLGLRRIEDISKIVQKSSPKHSETKTPKQQPKISLKMLNITPKSTQNHPRAPKSAPRGANIQPKSAALAGFGGRGVRISAPRGADFGALGWFFFGFVLGVAFCSLLEASKMVFGL